MVKFFTPGPGVLQQNPQMMGQQPVLAGATGNARGSNRMPMIPNNRIGLGEAMMRMGVILLVLQEMAVLLHSKLAQIPTVRSKTTTVPVRWKSTS